jgi:microcystin degradation protein MlrC
LPSHQEALRARRRHRAVQGALPRDYRKLPWRKIERPIWPLDAETAPRLII